MRAGEPNPTDPIDRSDPAQQLGEDRSPFAVQGQVSAKGVYVLAEQGHLYDTVGNETLHFPDDVPGSTRHLDTAHRGDDAEGAGVVAPDLDRHPRRVSKLAFDRQR